MHQGIWERFPNADKSPTFSQVYPKYWQSAECSPEEAYSRDCHLASDLLVEGGLPGGHGAAQDMFGLAGQLGLYLPLGPAQHEGPQHLVQAGDDQQLLLLIQLLRHILAGPLHHVFLEYLGTTTGRARQGA